MTGRNLLIAAGAFILLAAAAPAFAQGKPMDKALVALYAQAIETAAQIDAYETYCKTPKSKNKISDRILSGMGRRGGGKADLETLSAARDKILAEKTAAFAAEGADCKNVDFLFEKYVLVQKLEEQTFAIMDYGQEEKPAAKN